MTEVRMIGEEGTVEERQKQRAERDLLRQYLRGYLVASQRVADLNARLQTIREEYSELSSSKISAVVARSGISDPTPKKTLVENEVEERLVFAMNEAKQALIQREEVISLLAPISPERRVLELRYIDGKEGWEIGQAMNRGSSAVYEIEKNGLDQLLKMPSVRRLIS